MNIIHLEDDPKMLIKTEHALLQHDFKTDITYHQAYDEKELYVKFRACKPDGILLDISLNKDSKAGIKVLKKLRQEGFSGPIIMFSNIANVDVIASCLASGASDYVSKELGEVELAYRITKCIKDHMMMETLQNDSTFAGQTLRQVQYQMLQIIKSPIKSVFVFGETGTGKEVVWEILKASLDKNIPCKSINCGALPEDLVESELFGHKKGAFTDAKRDKKGLFELADGGFLFLDEVATLSPSAQVALLRVLENGEFTPIGAEKDKKVKVRIIAATNENLKKLIADGSFRLDLYQRLKSVKIELPPLRARTKEELSELIDFLVYQLNKGEQGDFAYHISPQAKLLLMNYDWREGNVRELSQIISAATIDPICRDNKKIIEAKSLPSYFIKNYNNAKELAVSSPKDSSSTQKASWNAPGNPSPCYHDIAFPLSFKDEEERLLSYVLKRFIDNHPDSLRYLTNIAKNIGIPTPTLQRKLNRLAEVGLLPKELDSFVN